MSLILLNNNGIRKQKKKLRERKKSLRQKVQEDKNALRSNQNMLCNYDLYEKQKKERNLIKINRQYDFLHYQWNDNLRATFNVRKAFISHLGQSNDTNT